MSYQYALLHQACKPVSETGEVLHQGDPSLRGRSDLAVAIPCGKDNGVPIVFWSRRVHVDKWTRGGSIQELLDGTPWRLDTEGGKVRYFKMFWRD